MSASAPQANWSRLFRIAHALITQVNSEQEIIDYWTFGGGTALMLQIDHRESRDIDIFFSDAQFLPFLDLQKHDFELEVQPVVCEGDGVRWLKLAFENVGAIDFIVASELTAAATMRKTIEDEAILLETIPEIITKKVYYRGSSIKPRDLFDIAAAGELHAESVVHELRSYRSEVARTLEAVDRLNPEFVDRAIAQLAIRDRYKPLARTALERSKELLRAVG